MSIAEAARLTGLPKAVISSRIAAGALRAVRHRGRRRIAVDELAERGLLPEIDPLDFDLEPTPRERELLDRLERQAEEIGHLRMQLSLLQNEAERNRPGRRRRR